MGGGASAPQPQATGSPDAAILAENERLKKEIDAAQKRADSAEASQKAAVAKQSEFEKLNADRASKNDRMEAWKPPLPAMVGMDPILLVFTMPFLSDILSPGA
eukprot:s171_g32.t1